MLTDIEKIVFLLLVAVSGYLSWKTFGTMAKVINSGQGKLHFDNLIKRMTEALVVLFSQRTVLKNRPLFSFIHSLIAWAFILYMLVNIGDVLTGFLPNFHFMGRGTIGNIYRLFVDIFSVFAIASVFLFLLRRFMFNSELLEIRGNVLLLDQAKKGIRRDSLLVGLFIIMHIGFRFVGESFMIAMTGPDHWQPFATEMATLWAGIPETSTIRIFIHVSWWLAIGLIVAFIPYFPYSKHAHLFMGPLNYMTAPNRSTYGTLERIDFENDEIEQFGAAKISHLDKTQIFDAYACIMCNRCQDVCPAYVTGKELSPSALEINKRYYINNNSDLIVAKDETEQNFLGFGISESALWACTTCAACVEVCPVGNEPMYDILSIRRDRVLMESQFPKELQGAFNGMERNQNPWNMNEDRLIWAKEAALDVKTAEENPDFDILYWVGCAGAFDQRGKNIAQSFTKILQAASVNFAVLGNNESCTGDSARRAGNEYLFSMMAEANVETLNNADVKKIVTTCPHCLHTLKNEYPQFGGKYQVIHHTQLIDQLISENKIDFIAGSTEKITFHDPCYLGRHNSIYDEPRKNLIAAGMDLVEMQRTKENSFCCSAGGAQMWKEEESGEERVRQNRFKEAEETGGSTVCTSCPFCLTMMRDASNELESKLNVKDIAEVIAEKIQ